MAVGVLDFMTGGGTGPDDGTGTSDGSCYLYYLGKVQEKAFRVAMVMDLRSDSC